MGLKIPIWQVLGQAIPIVFFILYISAYKNTNYI